MTERKNLKSFLNSKVDEYNQPFFIKEDPISVPHMFSEKQDIEIVGFFAAIFSWGNRITIINKSKELADLMKNAPYEFILSHSRSDLKALKNFRHRTFTYDDLLYFIDFLKRHYLKHQSLETAFFPEKNFSVEQGLNYFRQYFFSAAHLKRTEKHISCPRNQSACKRLNMFLRWMVRNDGKGVDFGFWKNISPADLIIPLDVHVARVARKLNLLKRKQPDWLAAKELTDALRKLDRKDPVKYDFALFHLGITEKY